MSRIWKERLTETLVYASAYTAILTLILIFIFIGKEALPLLFSPEVQEEANLKGMLLPLEGSYPFSWQPISTLPKYSLLPLILGTLKATFVSLVFAIPLAVGAAIYTSEFAPPLMKELVKPAIEMLAGIPSVILGFFALMVMASFLQNIFGFEQRLNAVNAGIALGLAVIPIVYTMVEDALTAVPKVFREGSVAMGATPWQTASRIVLPAAIPGILAACILGFGRAIGETMIVLMSSGNAAIVSLALTDSLRSLSATIAAELGEVVIGSPHYHVLFFLGTFLFLFTFAINFLGHWFVGRLKLRLMGKN